MTRSGSHHATNARKESQVTKKPTVLGGIKNFLNPFKSDDPGGNKAKAAGSKTSKSHPATQEPAGLVQQKIDVKVDGFVFTVKYRKDEAGNLSGAFVHSTHPEGKTVEQKTALYAVEEMILEHAVAGVDVQSSLYREGISRTLKNLRNRFGSYIPAPVHKR